MVRIVAVAGSAPDARNASAPTVIRIDGTRVSADRWTWDAATHTLTVTAPRQSVRRQLVVSYR